MDLMPMTDSKLFLDALCFHALQFRPERIATGGQCTRGRSALLSAMWSVHFRCMATFQ